jgi:hypothetical protein
MALKCCSGTVGGVSDVSGDQAALTRLCERLRTASEPTLLRARDGLGGAPIAEAVYALSQWAADAMGAPGPVPRLHLLASGDQLAVVGRELLDWAAANQDIAVIEEWRSRVQPLRDVV